MPLIRRRDQILSAGIDWLNDLKTREPDGPEASLIRALERTPAPEDVTESILRSVGKCPEPMVCLSCNQPIHNGWEFKADTVCLRCIITAQQALSRI